MGALEISLVKKRPRVLGMVPCRRGLLEQRSLPHVGITGSKDTLECSTAASSPVLFQALHPSFLTLAWSG